MKKVLIGLMAMGLVIGVASADVYTTTMVVTNGESEYSDQLPISGYLDKVEVVLTGGDALSTNMVMLGTWSGTTVTDIYVTNQITQPTAVKVYRPRFIGTTTAGTDIAGATASSTLASTNIVATTVLEAKYEKALVGSNLKIKLYGVGIINTCTNVIRIFTTDNP
jgi:hypothetical protein